jgi:AraC-like DNA-binding protein
MQNDYRKIHQVKSWPVKKVTLLAHKGKGRNYEHSGRAHPGHEIIYVDYGRIKIEKRNETINLASGDIIIMPEKKKHRFYGADKKPFDFLNIVYFGSLPKEIAEKRFHLSPEERSLLARIKEESLEMQTRYSEMIILKMNELIFSLQRKARVKSSEEKNKGENTVKYRSKLVNYALAFLHENYSHPFDAGEVAKHAGISKSHLRSLVRNETGKNLRTHLQEIRMDIAQKLLRESYNNIAEIAFKTGYQSVPHFCRIFKEKTGMTPAQYSQSLGIPQDKSS